MSSGSRIKILSDNALEDLYALPVLDDEDRKELFTIEETDKPVLDRMPSFPAKIDFLLQKGYFYAKQYFFNFTFRQVRQDTWYIINNYFPNTPFPKKSFNKHSHYANQRIILEKPSLFFHYPTIPITLEKKIMITIETLFKFIDKYEEILTQTESFGYVNLRLFCFYSEEDKHHLSFLATFDSAKRRDTTYDKDINEILSNLLEVDVRLWGEGAIGLKPSDYEEASNAPFSDMNKIIDYFIDTLIPYSTDSEPAEQDRRDAKERWQNKIARQSEATVSTLYSPGKFKPRIFSLVEQLANELVSLSEEKKGKILLDLMEKSNITLEELTQLTEHITLIASQPSCTPGKF